MQFVSVFVDEEDAAALVRRLEPDDEPAELFSMKWKIWHILAYSNR